jgi:hypothetical protein
MLQDIIKLIESHQQRIVQTKVCACICVCVCVCVCESVCVRMSACVFAGGCRKGCNAAR